MRRRKDDQGLAADVIWAEPWNGSSLKVHDLDDLGI